MSRAISILWKGLQQNGSIALRHAGSIASLTIPGGLGVREGLEFQISTDGGRLELEIEGEMTDVGPFATVVEVRTLIHPFSFFLRDVSVSAPIYISQYHVVVTDASDRRDYARIVQSIRSAGRQTRLQNIANASEPSFEKASKATRDLRCVTWLGLSRDIRNFEVDFHALTSDRA